MSYDPVQLLSERFVAAIAKVVPQAVGGAAGGNADPLITASRNPKLGDFQCNAAMPLGKLLGRPPRELALELVRAVDVSGVAEPLTEASVAGPGFINISLLRPALNELLGRLDTPGLGVERPATPETVVVDLCGVNLAKQMHVGHLRSTIIGDCLARVLERLGQRVIRQNHVGDWGLPIAMVTSKLAEMQERGEDLSTLRLDRLEKLYKNAQKDADADEKGLAAVRTYGLGPKAAAELEEQVAGATEALGRAKQTLLKLQSHDPATMALWRKIVDITMTECLKTCERLNTIVTAEHSAGESAYATELAGLVADLESRGVAETDQGALVVHVQGLEEPCLVRKSDGGFLYATTDLAAIRRRVRTLGASRVIYCVDARQSLHFRQVFGAAVKAGYATRGDGTLASLEHAAFGTVLGEDGKPLKTRSGENVKLSDLIDEAVGRAEKTVAEKSPELPEAERRAVAEAVGVAAIKFADLSSDRVKDYVFSYDRMLAFEGQTGPYLLYALVRIRSIFRKAGMVSGGAGVPPAIGFAITTPEEKALALALLRYPGVLKSVAQSLEPHRLCGYLYELAQAFSAFFTNCPVLQAPDEPTKLARLRLCGLTERVLADGLTTLGVRLVERM
jgi:arginyl-tRNA synthetase